MRKQLHPRDRRYTKLPAEELFDETGVTLPARRSRDLDLEDIKGCLRQGAVEFVVISFWQGEYCWKPRWIPLSECYRFWKTHVRERLCKEDAISSDELAEYPEGYCYSASEWLSDDRRNKIILLEMCD